MRTLKITLTAVVISSLFGEKLLNMETGTIVVEFKEGKACFNDRFLELEMKETGIYIPESKSGAFGEKEIVYLGDPQFEKAFTDVYYPLYIANSLYEWQD